MTLVLLMFLAVLVVAVFAARAVWTNAGREKS